MDEVHQLVWVLDSLLTHVLVVKQQILSMKMDGIFVRFVDVLLHFNIVFPFVGNDKICYIFICAINNLRLFFSQFNRELKF